MFDTEMVDIVEMQTDGEMQAVEEGSAVAHFSCNTNTPKRKRRAPKASTPIVDDEVRRSARLRRNVHTVMVQLDSQPRRKKGEAKKIVRFSTVEDLKKSIISGQIGQPMEINEEEPIEEEPIEVEPVEPSLLVSLGTDFCGVPLGELIVVALNEEEDHE